MLALVTLYTLHIYAHHYCFSSLSNMHNISMTCILTSLSMLRPLPVSHIHLNCSLCIFLFTLLCASYSDKFTITMSIYWHYHFFCCLLQLILIYAQFLIYFMPNTIVPHFSSTSTVVGHAHDLLLMVTISLNKFLHKHLRRTSLFVRREEHVFPSRNFFYIIFFYISLCFHLIKA